MKIRTRNYSADEYGFIVENDDGSLHSQSPLFGSRKDSRAAARKAAKEWGEGTEVIVEDEGKA